MRKNRYFLLLFVLGWPLLGMTQIPVHSECQQGQAEIARFIKDNPSFFSWHEQVQQEYGWLAKKLSPEQFREEDKRHCQWISNVKKELTLANYQQISPLQKRERCELFQKISSFYEKRHNELLEQMLSLGYEAGEKDRPFSTLVGKKYYFNRVHKNIEQNLIKINNIPVSKTILTAENFSKECGDIKVAFFNFTEENDKAQLYNQLLNSILPTGIKNVKNNPLQIDALLANHFHNQEYTYHYLEDIDYFDDRILSVTQTSYVYSGGAHGNTTINKTVFDLKKQARLQLDEILADNEMDKVLTLAKSQLIKERQLNPAKAWQEQQYWFDPKKIPSHIKWASAEDGFYLPKNFNISNQGITFVYQQYEITHYANGAPSFMLKWEDVKPYLNPKGVGTRYVAST